MGGIKFHTNPDLTFDISRVVLTLWNLKLYYIFGKNAIVGRSQFFHCFCPFLKKKRYYNPSVSVNYILKVC